MIQFILKRLSLSLAVALTVSLITFLLMHYTGDPAVTLAGTDASQAAIEQIRIQYGFDRPLYIQYLSWLGGIVTGDFGTSYYWRDQVLNLILTRAPITMVLAFGSLTITMIVGVTLGVLAAMKPDGWIDRFALAFGTSAQAVPNFWLGLVVIYIFAVKFPILPVSGDASWKHFVLPMFVLGLSTVPQILRLTRTGMIDVLASDYIRTAKANGFVMRQIVFRHALRNAMLPIVSVMTVQLGYKLGGAVVTETIFALNGLGRLAYDSVMGSDIITVQVLVFFFALIFVLLSLLGDLINAWLDPRIRLG